MSEIDVSRLTLAEVKQRLQIKEVNEPGFFPEWRQPLRDLPDWERRWLDKLKTDFLSLEQYPLHEELVKMAMLGPLLSLANFFQYPFYPQAEATVTFAAEDEGTVVNGRVDLLVVRQRLWVTVVESKNKRFSLIEAMPQALTYMASSQNASNVKDSLPTFGLVTNGTHFAFIKLVQDGGVRYGVSDEFSLKRQSNELYGVLGILRRIGELVSGWETSLSA